MSDVIDNPAAQESADPASAARSRPRIWRCGRFELSLETPLVMGILNVTSDSFSDGGRYEDPAAAVMHAERLIAEGAAILDVGGESTRPGADAVPIPAELSRVRPVIGRFSGDDTPLSIDTRHARVAAACVEAGASIVNDVSGFRDREMIDVAAGCDAGVVIMHMFGEPKTMQRDPRYGDVVAEVGGYLAAQAATLEAAGVARERIAIDPGIGFGKTPEHNLELLRRLSELVSLGYPLVIGASRKRFIGEFTNVADPAERFAGSVTAALFAVARGANVVRVHDVALTVQALSMQTALLGE